MPSRSIFSCTLRPGLGTTHAILRHTSKLMVSTGRLSCMLQTLQRHSVSSVDLQHRAQPCTAFLSNLGCLSVDYWLETSGTPLKSVCLHYVHSGSAGSRGSPLTQAVHTHRELHEGGCRVHDSCCFFSPLSRCSAGGLFNA